MNHMTNSCNPLGGGRRKCKLCLLVVCVVVMNTRASPRVSSALPSAVFADTEVSTNVVISTWEKGLAAFVFSLDFVASLSNNVEVTFGVDLDTDGQLSAHEERLTIGWNCGKWFAWGGQGERIAQTGTVLSERSCLSCSFCTDTAGMFRSFAASNGTEAIFAELATRPPAWLYARDWNLCRLTARGVDSPSLRFTAQVTPAGLIFLLR